ncbi:MAG TPA: ABC transporter substrate-binding protein [Stellaceae bacterium]|nr:ABC transporter substrate-binding protein [Stellaceae bacterium]
MGRLLKIACWDYDRVNPLRDGRAKIEGCDIEFTVNAPHNFFFRAGESPPYEVMEQSFSSYLTRRSRGRVPYTAIPIYPSRMFRHSAIYVRTDRIRTPGELKGKRIGVPFYGITAVMTARGLLADEYGVKPEDLIWVNGGLFDPKERLTQDLGLPHSIRIEQATEKSLSQLLIDGGIDGLITAASPSAAAMKAPHVGRLFPDYRAVEQAYYKKTRIFPIMHVLGIKTEVLERDPSLALRVYKGFCDAKDICLRDLDGDGGAVKATVPWLGPELEATRAAMGEDFWPYGIEKNRPTLEAVTRWSFEQHLSPRKLAVEELFAPETLAVG